MTARLDRLGRSPARRGSDERGAVAVIFAISMAIILAAAAFSFDIGRVVDANRSMQSVADAVAELVEEVLVSGSQLAVLATSREPLEVDGEEVVALAPLPPPRPPAAP